MLLCMLYPIIVLAWYHSSQSLEVQMITQLHTQNVDYRLRFAVSEWRKIEYELTRERGLWGPESPSPLNKWTLDTVEGILVWYQFHAIST